MGESNRFKKELEEFKILVNKVEIQTSTINLEVHTLKIMKRILSCLTQDSHKPIMWLVNSC